MKKNLTFIPLDTSSLFFLPFLKRLIYLLPIVLLLGAEASLSAQDIIPPTAKCQDITVQLDAGGQAQIAPSDINNGSTDDVTPPSSLGLSLDKSSFDCADIGRLTGWQTVGMDAVSEGFAKENSVAIAPDGTPYIAYQDYAINNSRQATVRKWNGSSWAALGGTKISQGAVAYLNLVIAPNSTPYIAYADAANSGAATVLKWDGSNWIALGGTGISAGLASNLSLAIDSNGILYLAYQDHANDSKTTVLTWNGSNWTALGGVGISVGSTSDQSLSIAPDGTPYVAYADAGGRADNRITVLKWNGSNWRTVGRAGFSQESAIDISIKIAPDGTPYVVYLENDYNNIVNFYLSKWDGNNWVDQGSTGFSQGTPNDPSLAIASDGTIYLAFQDRDTSYPWSIRTLEWNGSSWSEFFRTGNIKGWNTKQALAISPDDTPYLVYENADKARNSTVLELGHLVSLTVTDAASNSSACQANVRVEDNQAPKALCQDITVQLDLSGQVNIMPSEVDNGSSDVCGSVSLSINPNGFDCLSGPGTNFVTLTVSDESGKTSSCTSSVHLLTAPPSLSLNGNATIHTCQGLPYLDPGAFYTDFCTGFSGQVTGNTSQVNANVAGTYTVTYDYTDPNSTPSTQITRTVIVDPTPSLTQQGCGSCGQIRSNSCQFDPAPDLDAFVMANATYETGATLSWYEDDNNSVGDPLVSTPIVNTSQVSTQWYWVAQQTGACPSAPIQVRVRVKKLFTPDFNLPALGCGGSAQLDLATWVSDPKKKATAYTFYAVDPASNPGATPLGTASATKGVVNFGQYVLVNVSNGNQTYWVQSTVPNGCGGIASSILNAPAQTAVLDPIINQTFACGDPVDIAFSGQNITNIIWFDLAAFNNPPIGIMGSVGMGNLAFTASNSTGSTQTATIRVIPYNGNCAGQAQDFTISVQSGVGCRLSERNRLQLTGRQLTGGDIKLDWDISYEFDLIRFEVEKRIDEAAFVAISEVEWTGNGSYQYIDQSEMGSNNQYRLKLVLADGRIVWSETIEVNMDVVAQLPFDVFPNPSTDQFHVKALFPIESELNWQLSDRMGKVIQSGIIASQLTTIQTGHLPSAVYHLMVILPGGERYFMKVIKQ